MHNVFVDERVTEIYRFYGYRLYMVRGPVSTNLAYQLTLPSPMPCLESLIGNIVCLAYIPSKCLREPLRLLNMTPRAGDIYSIFISLNNVLGRTVCSRHGCRRVHNNSIGLAWRFRVSRRVHNRWNGLDSSRAAKRNSLDDRLSGVVSDVISVSTDRTSARCCENVRSRI